MVKKKNRVYLKAYYNMNLGDDLFLKILLDRYPEVIFCAIAEKKYREILENKNLKIISNNFIVKKIIGFFRKIKYSNNIIEIILNSFFCAIVNIGGSIFMEGQNHYLNFKDYKKQKNNWFILGCNFGPYKNEIFYKKYYEHFSKCIDVCFREKYSYNLFRNLPNIRYAKDIVFSLKGKNYMEEDYILISVIKPSIRKDLFEKDEEYFETIKNIVIDFIKLRKKVKLMSFCKNEGDEEAIEKIFDLIPNSYKGEVSKYFYRGNIDEALSIIGKSKIVVATRFHAMILGFIFEKIVYPIVYSKKMSNVLEDINFKQNFSTFNNLEDISTERILENKKIDKNTLEDIKRDSEKHFEKLDLFFNN